MDDDDLERDLPEGRRRRDEGMARALDGEDAWKAKARELVLMKVPPGWKGIAEDIRIMCADAGIVPHSPKCWGGYINGLLSKGILVKAPEPPGQMQLAKSHGKSSQILMRPVPDFMK